jgi:hypothetical protein
MTPRPTGATSGAVGQVNCPVVTAINEAIRVSVASLVASPA